MAIADRTLPKIRIHFLFVDNNSEDDSLAISKKVVVRRTKGSS